MVNCLVTSVHMSGGQPSSPKPHDLLGEAGCPPGIRAMKTSIKISLVLGVFIAFFH